MVNDKVFTSSTRRTFLKGLTALSASAATFGCSRSSSDEIYYSGGEYNPEENIAQDINSGAAEVWAGTAGHNCGGRCVTRAVKKDGKIIRILSDETDINPIYDPMAAGNDPVNGAADPRSRACSRCRSYVGRLYHPGRMKYPMKQIKKRGDLTGFVRISWEQAMEEIATKYSKIAEKYGDEAIYNHMSSGQQGPFNRAGGQNNTSMFAARVGPLSGGYLHHGYNYSAHQYSHFGTGFTGSTVYGGSSLVAADNVKVTGNAQDIAENARTLMLWGVHSLTSSNSDANAGIQTAEAIKNRADGKVYHINPTLEDTGITLATDWVQILPYTDGAFILAMMHQMIVNSFDASGNPLDKDQAWLDVDYLDTMVYGFFDSPGYWLEEETGKMGIPGVNNDGNGNNGIDCTVTVDSIDLSIEPTSLTPAGQRRFTVSTTANGLTAGNHLRWINPVPAGQSLSAYILGNNTLLQQANANYGNAVPKTSTNRVNYTSNIFSTSAKIKRNEGSASQINSANVNSTNYFYKSDMLVEKSPAWAEKVCGVPSATITEIAKRLCDDAKAGYPVHHQSSNGWQRNSEGVYMLFALQSLCIITQAWGRSGSGVIHSAGSRGAAYNNSTTGISIETTPENTYPLGNATYYYNNVPKIPSCTIWHAGVKFGYEMPNYTGKHIPDMDNSNTYGKAYADDSNVKSLIMHKMNSTYNSGSEDNLADKLSNTANTRYQEMATTLPDKDGIPRRYYDWETGGTLAGGAQAVGIRWILTMAGNAIINQHMNSNDTAEMLENLPLVEYNKAGVEDSFCYIALDTNFTPTMRWADYALPGAANWEMVDLVSGSGGAQQIYMPAAVPPPGEAKSGYEVMRLLSRYLGKVNPNKYTTVAKNFDNGKDQDDYIKEGFYKNVSASATKTFYMQRWNGDYEKYKRNGYMLKTPNNTPVTDNTLWRAWETYESTDIAATTTVPFIKTTSGIATNEGSSYVNATANPITGYAVADTYPFGSLRFHVYSEILVWEYEHRNEKFHGYLNPEDRGNNNVDKDGDPIVFPVAVYCGYRDYFKEAYGTDYLAISNEADKPLMVTGNHIRYRSHSTFNDSPLLRELAKAAKGGGIPRDTGTYSDVITKENEDGSLEVKALGDVNDPGYGYERFWMNPDDAAARGIENGDIVLAGNTIGTVRVVASTSHRVPKGVAYLPQGGWYDPDENGIDNGGCANTICASLPSRCDHGNCQNTALVQVRKEA